MRSCDSNLKCLLLHNEFSFTYIFLTVVSIQHILCSVLFILNTATMLEQRQDGGMIDICE